MNNYTVATNLLQGLGKPTRRGIKKCSKCGILNGTRGTFCKNRQCGARLQSCQDHLFDFDAVKLVTGTVRQVYSVRVKEMVLPFSRGFVQLPVLQDKESVLSNVALCFVNSCQRSFDNSILKCHEEGQNQEAEICSHIELSLKSEISAKPISLDLNILKRLRIPNEFKEKLNKLIIDSDCPLVQRVSKDSMAVRCQVTSKQPLGYLHCTFVKGRTKTYEKYYCSCVDYLNSMRCNKSASVKYKCIHYYACIVALLSDREYFEEFSQFLNNEIYPKGKQESTSIPKVAKQFDTFSVIQNQLIKTTNLSRKESIKSSIKKQKHMMKKCKKIVPKIYPIEIKVISDSSITKNTNNGITWPFLDWLAFVTESINKTMQFMNCGILNTQVFYIPEAFYQSLKDRIPSNYIEENNQDGSVFYNIMNVNHVKEIFDTPQVKLRIAKKFVHDDQNGYVEYDDNNDFNEGGSLYRSSFIFFLNVGQSTVDESDNCNNAFILEWIPNIFSTSKVGQLRIQYKYGRKSI